MHRNGLTFAIGLCQTNVELLSHLISVDETVESGLSLRILMENYVLRGFDGA